MIEMHLATGASRTARCFRKSSLFKPESRVVGLKLDSIVAAVQALPSFSFRSAWFITVLSVSVSMSTYCLKTL